MGKPLLIRGGATSLGPWFAKERWGPARLRNDFGETVVEAADVPGSGAANAGEKRGTVTFEAFDDAITALRGAAEKQAE